MEHVSEFVDRVCQQVYQAYLDGYSRFDVPDLIGSDFDRCRWELATLLGCEPSRFDLIDYVLLHNPVYPVQPWEREILQQTAEWAEKERKRKEEEARRLGGWYQEKGKPG